MLTPSLSVNYNHKHLIVIFNMQEHKKWKLHLRSAPWFCGILRSKCRFGDIFEKGWRILNKIYLATHCLWCPKELSCLLVFWVALYSVVLYLELAVFSGLEVGTLVLSSHNMYESKRDYELVSLSVNMNITPLSPINPPVLV